MASIRFAVGPGCLNFLDDVLEVQRLLFNLDSINFKLQTGKQHITGSCDENTKSAIKNFQQRMLGMVLIDPEWGRVAPKSRTFQALAAKNVQSIPAHILFPQGPLLESVTTQMPESGKGFYCYNKSTEPGFHKSRRNQYGRQQMIGVLKQVAEQWYAKYPGIRIGIGHLSQFGGSPNKVDHPKGGHPKGLVADLRPFRKDRAEQPVSYRDTKVYDRELTQELVNLFLQLKSVKSVRFNDPEVKNPPGIAGKLQRDGKGSVHDNHLHIEFDGDVLK